MKQSLVWFIGVTLVLVLGVAVWAQASDWPLVTVTRPWWLALLALLVPLVWLSWPRLAGLGPARRVLALYLRAVLVVLLILALADLQVVREEEGVTTILLIDRSFSIPIEVDENNSTRDVRWERLTAAVRQATQRQGRDRVGVISFSRTPRLEFPAGPTTPYGLNLRSIGAGLDRNFTDIGAAIRLGLASFPEGGARRLVLISDGNENRGDALAEAKVAQLNQIPIDVVPIRYQFGEEVLVDRLDMPAETPPGEDIPLRVVLRNFSGRRVSGKLIISRSFGDTVERAQQSATLEPGLNVLQTKWPAPPAGVAGVTNYRAAFIPDELPGDRADNNEAWQPVIIKRRERQILFIVQDAQSPRHQPLQQALQNRLSSAHGQVNIVVWTPDRLPSEKDSRRFELTQFDTVIFVNIPADLVNREQQEALRKAIRDQGVGLVMTGGPDAFGAGRWQGEPLEEALPVDTAIRAKKANVKGGLVLIMHASEMVEGNYWQKEIARLAISKLAPQDEVGVLYYGYDVPPQGAMGGHRWHVPLQEVGPNRAKILRAIGTMEPGDMPQFDPSIILAEEALSDPQRGLGVRHIILISDGDHGLLQDLTLLNKLKQSRITLTTVGVTTHGTAAQEALANISKRVGGRHYAVDDPNHLPAIYMRETRVINQNFLVLRHFQPALTGLLADPLREWSRPLPPLRGFVRTSPKQSELVQELIVAPLGGTEDQYPILTQWQYGLGRVVAFTSDVAGGADGWSQDWLTAGNVETFNDFWSRVVDWSLRTVQDAGLSVQTQYENGRIRVTVIDNRDAAERARRPLGNLGIRVTSSATTESADATLEPIAAGVYEATVPAEAAGSYAVTVHGTAIVGGQSRSVIMGRSATAVPYAPEFAAVQDNAGLLQQIAALTGGRVINERDLAGADLFVSDGSFRRRLQPVWHWLLCLAAVTLLVDVAVRRIAIEPREVAGWLQARWQRLRGQKALAAESQQYLDRLKTRKAEVEERLGTAKDRPLVEAWSPPAPSATGPPVTSPAAKAPPAAPPQAPPPVAPAPPSAAPAEDFAARLLRAKQKAREQMQEPPRDELQPPSA